MAAVLGESEQICRWCNRRRWPDNRRCWFGGCSGRIHSVRLHLNCRYSNDEYHEIDRNRYKIKQITRRKFLKSKHVVCASVNLMNEQRSNQRSILTSLRSVWMSLSLALPRTLDSPLNRLAPRSTRSFSIRSGTALTRPRVGEGEKRGEKR